MSEANDEGPPRKMTMEEKKNEEETNRETTKIPLRPNPGGRKWVILVLSSFLLLGCYYSYDVPTAVKENMRQYMGYGHESVK